MIFAGSPELDGADSIFADRVSTSLLNSAFLLRQLVLDRAAPQIGFAHDNKLFRLTLRVVAWRGHVWLLRVLILGPPENALEEGVRRSV